MIYYIMATIDDVLKELREFKAETRKDIREIKDTTNWLRDNIVGLAGGVRQLEDTVNTLGDQTTKDITWLKEQTGANCIKLDTMQTDITDIKTDVTEIKDKTLPGLSEIMRGYGQNHEALEKRVTDLEPSKR